MKENTKGGFDMATQEEREAYQRRMDEVLKGNNMYLPEHRKESVKDILFLSVGGICLNLVLGLIFGAITSLSGSADFLRAIKITECLFGIPTALTGLFIFYHPATEKYALILSCVTWFASWGAYEKYGIIFAVFAFIFISSLGTTICKLMAYKEAWKVDTTNDINVMRNYQEKFKKDLAPFIVFAVIGAMGVIVNIFF